MKYYTAVLTIIILLLCSGGIGMAHGISIVTYTDADAIQIECSSGNEKIAQEKITILDSVTKEKLLEGTTDEQGLFHFHPEHEFLDKEHGLTIRLDAGAGHQRTVQVSTKELERLHPSTATSNPTSPEQIETTTPDGQQKKQTAHLETQEIDASHISIEQLEATVSKVISSELTPIKQTLARQENSGPSLKDIVGGLGWILGLLGIATYFKYRR